MINLERFFGGHAAWIGDKPVHVAKAINLEAATNWRASSTLHGKFDRVWLFEKELFSYGPSWPLLLDETVRLLGQQGYLIVRTKDCWDGTLFELKSLIANKPDTNSELAYQAKQTNGDIVSVIQIQRTQHDIYADNSWSIGILSNGAKSENVHALVEKLIRLAGDRAIEFIIAGPEAINVPSHIRTNIHRWIDRPDENLPRISEKKRWIVEQATNTNLAIFHDRYQVDDNFFEGFDQFGYDFDYATISQRYESGKYYPSYVGFPLNKMRWQHPVYDKTYRSLHDGHFINGGLIILKRNIAMQINFNSLLLHNEAEDVELGFRMRSHGVIPRMNSYSSALALGVPDNYTISFREISPANPTPPPNKLQRALRKLAIATWHKLSPKTKQSIQKNRIYESLKKHLRIGG